MLSTITAATAHWIREPLCRPYELSFGKLTAFDVMIVEVVTEDGSVGYGESCPVPPYSEETTAQVWQSLADILPTLVGAEPSWVLQSLATRSGGSESFSYVAPTTAVESLVNPVSNETELAIPVVGTVLVHDGAGLRKEIQALVATGYETLKVKVGFDPVVDARRVGCIQEEIPDGVQLRLDANEGWDPPQAAEFLKRIDPSGIELLEQPFPRTRWDWVADLVEQNPSVALMLDESIHSEESIARAAEVGVQLVKLKLMKTGSREALSRRLRFAQDLGLSVVIGNGIAGVVDNWYEAVCARGTPRAGEMNGNLKLRHSVLTQRPVLSRGNLRFPAGFQLETQADELLRRSERSLIF